MPDIKDFKKRFDPYITQYFTQKIEEVSRHLSDPTILEWISYLQTLLLHGGKRIRPYVAYSMYCSSGGRNEDAIYRTIVGLELFHLFALVHDDIIDQGKKRHGVDSAHVHIEQILKSQKRRGDYKQMSKGQALIAGDLLFNWAVEVFANHGFTMAQKSTAKTLYHQMIDEVIIGQMIDTDCASRDKVTHELLQTKIELKTARYTFVRPMQIGVVLANGTDELLQFCRRYGTALGMAFQIQDDLLDIVSCQSIVQKPILQDIQSHQPTLFTQYIFEKGTKAEQIELARYFGTSLTLEKKQRVIDLFYESGAIRYGQRIIRKYFEEAICIVQTSNLPHQDKQIWEELICFVRKRIS